MLVSSPDIAGHLPRRSSSALARAGSLVKSASMSMLPPLAAAAPCRGSSFVAASYNGSFPAETEPHHLDGMIIAGSPAPVGVKKERAAVVVSPPSPPPASVSSHSASFRQSTNSDSQAQTTTPTAAAAQTRKREGESSCRPKASTRTSSEEIGATMASAAAALKALACDELALSAGGDASSPAAGSGLQAVAALASARGRSTQVRNPDAPANRKPRSNSVGPPKKEVTRSHTSQPSLAQTTSGIQTSARSSSIAATRSSKTEKPQEDKKEPSSGCISPQKPQIQLSSTTAALTMSTSISSPAALVRKQSTVNQNETRISTAPGVPTVKKFAVQANAYHCTFVQSMMTSRGPEWKPTLRSAEKLTAADIATCDFVWFKYEYIKSLPHIDRQRLSDPMIQKLQQRTDEMRNMWNEGITSWPDHSNDPVLAAMDLLNAFVMPEEAETPVATTPLNNVQRKRMPNMLMCQSSVAHVVGQPSPSTPPEVTKAFHELKSLLHYHHVKIARGTPIIGCFKEASAVWRKHLLYRHMKQYCDNKPDVRGSVRERMPASFEYDLNSPTAAEDALHFMQTLMSEGPHPVVRWLAKATGGANGNGFYVTKDPADMVRYVGGQPKKVGGETDFWIIQEFVEKMPLLFDGHRFHMKVHVVMIATPVGIDVYAYKKQRIQCCSELYDPDVMHPLSYIGNWGQQRFATNLVQEKFSTLLEDIKGEYPLLLPAWHRAKQLIAEAIEAAWLCGRQFFNFEPGCYELMGWDFVMEECPDGIWRPLLVEANHRPGFGSERKYMEKLIHEVLELVMYPINGVTKYQKETHNGVVEAIWDHVKTIVIHPAGQQDKQAAPAC